MLGPVRLPLIVAVLCVGNVVGKWRELGEQWCPRIVDPDTREDCKACFEAAGEVTSQARKCLKEYLHPRMGKCVAGNPTDAEVASCLTVAEKQMKFTAKKTHILMKDGGKGLKNVLDSRIISEGGPAVLSCIAQELLITDKILEKVVDKDCEHCFERFKQDNADEAWHMHKPNKGNSTNHKPVQRTSMVYEYGEMGHDMPFRGVGPLAVDVLKGKCVTKCLADEGHLDKLLEVVYSNAIPLPGWMFQDILNSISSINLPE